MTCHARVIPDEDGVRVECDCHFASDEEYDKHGLALAREWISDVEAGRVSMPGGEPC